VTLGTTAAVAATGCALPNGLGLPIVAVGQVFRSVIDPEFRYMPVCLARAQIVLWAPDQEHRGFALTAHVVDGRLRNLKGRARAWAENLGKTTVFEDLCLARS